MAGQHPRAVAARRKQHEDDHELRMYAYYLRMEGWSYHQIGQEVNRTPETIKHWISKIMETLEKDTVAEIKELERARLDKLQVAVNPILGADNPELRLKGIDRALRISESRRKLEGVDAAEKLHVEVEEKSPAEQELEDLIKRMNKNVQDEENRLKTPDPDYERED